MPASYAHYRFGKQVLKNMPAGQKQCVQRFRRMYDLGLQGPDIFFYFNPFMKTAVGDLGVQFHLTSGRDFFPKACKAAESEAAQAYLYGLLAHYCLDSVCHPTVNRLDAIGEAKHAVLEAEFERFLLVQDGEASPETFDMSKKWKPTRGECMTVAQMYPGATGGSVSRSVKSMVFFTRFLTKPGHDKLLRKLGLPFADDQIPAKANEELAVYVGELKGLYDQAAANYPRLLSQLLAHMESEEPLGEEFTPDFG